MCKIVQCCEIKTCAFFHKVLLLLYLLLVLLTTLISSISQSITGNLQRRQPKLLLLHKTVRFWVYFWKHRLVRHIERSRQWSWRLSGTFHRYLVEGVIRSTIKIPTTTDGGDETPHAPFAHAPVIYYYPQNHNKTIGDARLSPLAEQFRGATSRFTT